MSDHPPQADLGRLIRALVKAGVEFMIVGGAAAVFHGAPTTTVDLDIVPRQTPENAERLPAVLDALDAFVEEPAHRRLRPDRSLLLGRGQPALSTSSGPLDLLCRLHDGRGYDDLLEHTVWLTDGESRIRAIDLQTLVIKAAAGRPKDRLVVPVLLAMLAERDREPNKDPE